MSAVTAVMSSAGISKQSMVAVQGLTQRVSIHDVMSIGRHRLPCMSNGTGAGKSVSCNEFGNGTEAEKDGKVVLGPEAVLRGTNGGFVSGGVPHQCHSGRGRFWCTSPTQFRGAAWGLVASYG